VLKRLTTTASWLAVATILLIGPAVLGTVMIDGPSDGIAAEQGKGNNNNNGKGNSNGNGQATRQGDGEPAGEPRDAANDAADKGKRKPKPKPKPRPTPNPVNNPLLLGQTTNTATATTLLTGATGSDGVLSIRNVNSNPALALQVTSGPPMTTNSAERVTNLNADLVDGRNAEQFVGSRIYKRESPSGPGRDNGDLTFTIDQACDPGDVLLSGGPADVANFSVLVESFPTPNNLASWTVRINRAGARDDFKVAVLCADQPGTPAP
jgi:hypothetical protein